MDVEELDKKIEEVHKKMEEKAQYIISKIPELYELMRERNIKILNKIGKELSVKSLHYQLMASELQKGEKFLVVTNEEGGEDTMYSRGKNLLASIVKSESERRLSKEQYSIVEKKVKEKKVVKNDE